MILHYVKLCRPINLLLLAGTQALFQYYVVVPALNSANITPTLSVGLFIALVCSCVCIAAAGYVSNDVFDQEIDRINKPNKRIVGALIPMQKAIYFSYVLNAVGVLLSFAVCYAIGNFRLMYLIVFTVALLWFYAMQIKKTLIIGNVLVAFLTALSIIIVPLFETEVYQYLVSDSMSKAAEVIVLYMGAYAAFAFAVNFVREIVKDIEDHEGDRKYSVKSIPIILGLVTTKWIVTIMTIVILIAVSIIQLIYTQNKAGWQSAYILVALQLPLFYVGFKMLNFRRINHAASISKWFKFILFAGVFTIPLFHYLAQL